MEQALDAVQTRMDMSWSISLHSIFKEFQVDADLWDGTPFVQLHASTCSLNVTNTAETGLDVEAAVRIGDEERKAPCPASQAIEKDKRREKGAANRRYSFVFLSAVILVYICVVMRRRCDLQ